MRYVFKLSYDGTSYAGWQRQKNALSVQEALEKGMESALGVPCRVTASGRTDAGVHAAGQMCHFDAEGLTVPPEKLPDCVNRFLPSISEFWRGGPRQGRILTVTAAPRKRPIVIPSMYRNGRFP